MIAASLCIDRNDVNFAVCGVWGRSSSSFRRDNLHVSRIYGEPFLVSSDAMLLLTTARLLWGVSIEFLGARFSTEQRRSALLVLFGN